MKVIQSHASTKNWSAAGTALENGTQPAAELPEIPNENKLQPDAKAKAKAKVKAKGTKRKAEKSDSSDSSSSDENEENDEKDEKDESDKDDDKVAQDAKDPVEVIKSILPTMTPEHRAAARALLRSSA